MITLRKCLKRKLKREVLLKPKKRSPESFQQEEKLRKHLRILEQKYGKLETKPRPENSDDIPKVKRRRRSRKKKRKLGSYDENILDLKELCVKNDIGRKDEYDRERYNK